MNDMIAERKAELAVGQDDRFEALFVAHYPRVVAIARKVLGESHLAEDVAQDVFASFYHLHPSDPRYAPRWLHAAAVHTALNVLRGNQRRLRREQADGRDATLLRDQHAAAPDPQRIVESKERRREVQGALRRLSPKHAAVLALRYGGLSYAEVAAALDLGINQVGTLLARAETAFKKEITRVTPR